MKILFVCNLGKHRSRTAAELLSNQYETRYKGVYDNLVSKEDLEWADLVCVMEDHQRTEISERFPEQYMKKKIISLNIPDIYSFGDERLKEEIKEKLVL